MRIGDVYVSIRGDLSEFNRSLSQLNSSVASTSSSLGKTLGSVGRSATTIGSTMTTNLTLPILAIGGAATKMGLDFDTSLRRIVGLTDITQDQIGGIREQLLKLGPEIGKSPQELADAFYFIASSGFKADEAMKVLEVSAKAAASGLGNTSDVAKTLGGVINAYGKENLTASHAADILTEAVSQGAAEASDFASQIGTVTPGAAALGVSFDQLAAAMAGMTLTGISAAESATSLTQIFSTLRKPTKQTEDGLKALGLSSAGLRQELKEKGLLATLRTLEERFGGDEVAAGQVFGNIRALRGVSALLTLDTAQLNDVFGKVTDSQGRAAKAYEETEGPQRKLARSMADLQATAITLGTDILPTVVDILRELASGARDFAKWWGTLDEGTKKSIIQWALFVAAAGPVIKASGLILQAFSGVFKSIGFLLGPKGIPKLIGAMGGLGSAMRAVAGIGIAAVLYEAGQATADFVAEAIHGKAAGAVFKQLSDAMGPVAQYTGDVETAFDNLRTLAHDTGKPIGELADQFLALRASGLGTIEALKQVTAQAHLFTPALDAAGKAWEKYQNQIIPGAKAVTATITDETGKQVQVFEDGSTAIVDDAAAMTDEMAKALEEAKKAGVQAMRDMLDGMEHVLADGPKQIQDEIDAIQTALTDPYTEVERQTDLEVGLAMKAIRDTLKSEDPKIAADAFEQANNWLKQYDILEPGMIEKGKTLNPAMQSGVQSNLMALLAYARDNVAGEYMKQFGVPLSTALHDLGYESLAQFAKGVEDQEAFLASKKWADTRVTIKNQFNIDLYDKGKAAGDSFRNGFNSTLPQATADFYAYAATLRGIHFSSEPKDPRSPWRGWGKVGAIGAHAFIDSWLSTLPAARAAMYQFSNAMASGGIPSLPAYAGAGASSGSGAVPASAPVLGGGGDTYILNINGEKRPVKTPQDAIRTLTRLGTFG